MKLPETTTAKVYVWMTSTNLPVPHIATTTVHGMEAHGWTLLVTKNVEIDLTDLDIDPCELRKTAILNRKESTEKRYEQELIALEDELRLVEEVR